MTTRQLHLNVNANALGRSQHWQQSEHPLGFLDLGKWEELGKLAERGLLDAVFLADALGGGFGAGAEYTRPWNALDPFFPLTAIARATQHIGVVATVSTTFKHPYDIARLGSSLDFASRGRAAINFVTTRAGAAQALYGIPELPDYDARHARADEAIQIVKALWDSWDEGALVVDRETGTFVDQDKVRRVQFRGSYLSIDTRFQIPRSPQGRPVILAAGGSPQGVELQAKHADAVFCAAHTLDTGKKQYQQLKARAAAYGRSADEILILPGLFITLGSTEAEAQRRRKQLDEAEPSAEQIRLLAHTVGVPAESLELDAKLPWHLIEQPGHKLRSQGFGNAVLKVARDENLTVRELIERDIVSGHRSVVGTPELLADDLSLWFTERAADGFNFNFDTFPTDLADIVEQLIPALQKRGIYRSEYESDTLRGQLGLPAPRSSWSVPAAAAVAV